MQVPVRLINAVRPGLPLGLLAGVTAGTVVIATTPLVLASVADEYGVGLGVVGLMSTLQLAGFVAGSWLGPRFLSARRRVVVAALLLGAAANLACAALPPWPMFLGLRALSGIGLGVMAWLAWREAFGDGRRTSELNIAGPITVMIATPVLVWIIERQGPAGTFLLLGALLALPIVLPNRPSALPDEATARSGAPPVRPALLLLIALGLFTCGGSVIFVYSGVIGTEHLGISPAAISLAFMGNSVLGVLASIAPVFRRPALAGFWLLACSLCALSMGVGDTAALFVPAMILWGYFFFTGIPATFALLAARSRFPDERAGDAQAVMAAGRIIGPALGGALVAAGSFATLGIVAMLIMAVAGVIIIVVHQRFEPVSDT